MAPRAKPDLVLFHWSPRERRASIQRHGLRPRSWSPDRLWRPPFVCLSEDPILAWHLSGRLRPEIPDWDLWQVLAHYLEGYEMIFDTFPDTGRQFVKEFRVYERIPKADVRFVGERSQRAPR